ncbi:hypothetical protein FHS76_000489 [Ochrobactrum daejeonense]|uniref:Uncharacterized protein n=1 Tax=Brucella daejeonensis TaxID=659015 RepID=A0A7W9AU96_9HYPH|nr:hypothetical protein [Brucella daejeonensis]MBB5700646.1 hypothetical protein [Brucella daejeonensis]
MAIIKAGTILAFCGGEWSDKWTTRPFTVLKDFDQQVVVDAYRAGFVPKDEWDELDEHGFAGWLTRSGYIEDVPNSYNWYVGAYGEFDPQIATSANHG